VKGTCVVVGSIVFAGCSAICAKTQSPDTEVRHSWSQPAKKVYVKYRGPERLTRRFSKFFEIAADDYQIALASKPGEADAQMEVTVNEKDTHDVINGKILHLGFLLRGGGHTTVHYCESTSESSDLPNDTTDVLFGLLSAKNVAGELKKSQPQVSNVYVSPIKNNIQPQVVEAIKAEFARGNFHPAADAASADAVLRTMGTTVEPIGVSGTTRHINIEISGVTIYSSKSSQTIYKSVDKNVPERSQPCLKDVQSNLASGRNGTDEFWSSAVAAARELANPKKENHSKKD
jgi:hypothetical protein